ncbi:hypothetical protein CPT_Summit_091 [Stenotrophomonas phage Summit]|nr:hypothetical protein CPT_Summit_091 [Stenotrophomonas phage Summit]
MNELLLCLTGVTLIMTAWWADTRMGTKLYRVLSWVIGTLLVLLALGVIERMIHLFTAF